MKLSLCFIASLISISVVRALPILSTTHHLQTRADTPSGSDPHPDPPPPRRFTVEWAKRLFNSTLRPKPSGAEIPHVPNSPSRSDPHPDTPSGGDPPPHPDLPRLTPSGSDPHPDFDPPLKLSNQPINTPKPTSPS